MVRSIIPPPPPPSMPRVAEAQHSVKDAKQALDRAMNAWNQAQLRDALRSAKYFIAIAETSLGDEKS